MHGELRVVDDVAPAFSEVVAEAWHARPGRGFSIALSGGETARRCYEHLATWDESPIDWMATEVYWGDERRVPLDHPDSNYRLAAESLLQQVAGVHALFPMRSEAGADAYQMQLSTIGALDVVHLGLGADGHTASLFPDSPALDADPGRLVSTNDDPHGVHPHPRLTLTYAGIARGRTVVVTVAGADKASAFDAVRRGADVPAARLRAEHLVWIVDRQAADEAD
ncbi:MAG: 6-phosphogluconolactonase [Acidimicrobiales bacterium]|nr:6-phosphogluconolactonase [Acidimicrobiales bacterium]